MNGPTTFPPVSPTFEGANLNTLVECWGTLFRIYAGAMIYRELIPFRY